MDLSTFISQNTGIAVGSGECGELVDLWLVEGFGNHTAYNTALEYWQNGIPGFSITSSPQPRDIACYNAHPGFPDGHIAIYVGNGQVFEQNADPDGSPPHLFNRSTQYLLGYLTQGGEEMINSGDVQNVYKALLGRDATSEDDAVWVGKDWKTFIYGVIESAEFKNHQASLSKVDKETALNYIENNLQ